MYPGALSAHSTICELASRIIKHIIPNFPRMPWKQLTTLVVQEERQFKKFLCSIFGGKKKKATHFFILPPPGSVVDNLFSVTIILTMNCKKNYSPPFILIIQKCLSEHLLTMLEWTVACSMYLAIPVTNAFLSSKLVLKFGYRERKTWN